VKKIKVINPMTEIGEHFAKFCSEMPDVDVESITEGPAVIHNRYDVALAAPDTVRHVQKAESEGYGAVLFTCHADPNLAAAREGVRIPVIGCLETSTHFCAMLGTKFTILTPNKAIQRWQEENIQKYGLTSRLASIRTVKFAIPLEEILALGSKRPLPKEVQELVAMTVVEATKAVEEDDATAIIFGCGGFLWLEDEVENQLRKKGVNVLIINPLALTIEVARLLVKLGLSHSVLAYPYLEI